MSFAEAVRTCLRKYATFAGRARRAEYWWFALLVAIAYGVGLLLDRVVGTDLVFSSLAVLGLLVPFIAVTVRRLHDSDRSGAWYFIGVIPLVGEIWLVVLMSLDSKPFDNRFGPSPKYGSSARGWA